MSQQLIEMAVRRAKPGKEAAFDKRKDAAVSALLDVRGVGPERAFVAFSTTPVTETVVHVGMTRYADKAAQSRAQRSPKVLGRLMAFLATARMHVGVVLAPDDHGFDIATFATAPGCVVEFAALVPAPGVSREDFVSRRSAYLRELEKHDGVLATHTFRTAGGLKGKDSLVHFVEYHDRDACDAVQAQMAELPEYAALRESSDGRMTAFASVSV